METIGEVLVKSLKRADLGGGSWSTGPLPAELPEPDENDEFMYGSLGEDRSMMYLLERVVPKRDDSGLPGSGDLEFETVTAPKNKLAMFLPMSKGMLQDDRALTLYLDQQGPKFIQAIERDYVWGRLFEAAGTRLRRWRLGAAIRAAERHVRNDGYLQPTGLVVHPDRAKKVRKALSKIGSRLTVEESSVLARNALLVLNVRESTQIFRSLATAEASNIHQDFLHNALPAVRVEWTISIPVYRPQALCSIKLWRWKA